MKLTFGYSPCPNDTFMFEPIVSKRVDTEGLEFEIILEDVESLNKSAFERAYDITKLSYNAYTSLVTDYQLLNSGSALGRNCGPLLIAKRQLSGNELQKAIIGIPGVNTTANFLLSYAFPDTLDKRSMVFSEIEDKVLSGEVDAGVIIHENRFTYHEKGLIKIKDLGEYWEEKTGCPIPLGGIVVKRDLDTSLKQTIDRVIGRSVAYAMANPSSGMNYIKLHAQEMEEEVMNAHIGLYVNDYSYNINQEGRAAIEKLFQLHPAIDIDQQPDLFVSQD